ncbi:MAG: ParA family protein [Chlorobiota bacterium]|jgi:chromosome partitioning protein|nr:ParA family protein [Chlorobiota bacterium]QQS66839.1 MAG: ParA family protein [Chlorobiota bacterium]
MGKIIALANQKGGVGKTTSAINLAASLATAEQPTLLLDVDPQGNASSGFGIDAHKLDKTIYEVLVEDLPLNEAIMRTELGYLDIIPSNMNLYGAEPELKERGNRVFVLSKALEQAKKKYSYIILDCPPNLGFLTLNALIASDSVIIPVQCEYYALEGLRRLLKTIFDIQQSANKKLQLEGILLTMHDSRLKLSNLVISEVRRYLGNKVFDTVISRNVKLSEAPSHGKPVILYDALSIGTKNYLDLASEIMRNAELAIEKSTLEENVVSIENLPESVTSLLIDKKENS